VHAGILNVSSEQEVLLPPNVMFKVGVTGHRLISGCLSCREALILVCAQVEGRVQQGELTIVQLKEIPSSDLLVKLSAFGEAPSESVGAPSSIKESSPKVLSPMCFIVRSSASFFVLIE
jgi:hypothetical protein